MILWYCYAVWGVGAITMRWWLPFVVANGDYLRLKAFLNLLLMPITLAVATFIILWLVLFTVLTYRSSACQWLSVEEEPEKPQDWLPDEE